MKKYLYETCITGNKSIETIYYNSNDFPCAEDIKKYHSSIIIGNVDDDLLRDTLLNTLSDMVASVDFSNAYQLFSDDTEISMHQEYFAFRNTKILLRIQRFDITDVSHHTTLIYSDERDDKS